MRGPVESDTLVDVSVRRPGGSIGERCGRVIRELGLPKVLSETACRGDDRQTFGYGSGRTGGERLAHARITVGTRNSFGATAVAAGPVDLAAGQIPTDWTARIRTCTPRDRMPANALRPRTRPWSCEWFVTIST
jgi:hypothetical protein